MEKRSRWRRPYAEASALRERYRPATIPADRSQADDKAIHALD